MPYGPIELLVLEHAEPEPPAAVVSALRRFTESGLIGIVDVVLVIRDADGAVTWLELPDMEPALAGSLDPIVAEITGLVSADDLVDIGATVPPGGSAFVVVVEHRWPSLLEAETRSAGGTISLHMRIPRNAVEEVVAAHTAAAS